MTTKEINKKLLELFENRPSNCNSISYTRKVKDGKLTDEWSFSYQVEKKKLKSELSDSDIIPQTIEINNQSIKTDVVEGINRFTSYNFFDIENCPCDFYEWSDNFCDSTETPNPNGNTYRPLVGGIRVRSSVGSGSGTLGLIAVDSHDGSVVGLTNNHVVIRDAFFTSEWNVLDVKRTNMPSSVYQPFSTVGAIKRYVPLVSQGNGINLVDAALVTLDQGTISNTVSISQLNLSLNYPLPFATTEEIDDLINNNWDFFSSGYTTRDKGQGQTKLKFSGYGVISLSNQLQNGSKSAVFSETIEYVASASTTTEGKICWDPIYNGDSGSALIARINGVDKVIGLCFAGRGYSNVETYNGNSFIRYYKGVACRIDNVVNQLNIEPYTGQTVNFSDRTNPQYVYVSGQSNQISVNQDGNTYYQSGLLDL